MGTINETDAKKRLRARSGHSQRASAKTTAEADEATAKKERGMERESDSDRASNRGTNARKVTDPEKEGPSREGRTLADSQPQGGSQQAHRQPQVAKRTVRQRPKPHPKEKAPSPKNNLLTGGRAEQVDLEADLRPGEHNGETQEPPKTRSFSEDQPVRGRQRLQGAS